jgi:transcriptional regulator with XRE-family HTH domain
MSLMERVGRNVRKYRLARKWTQRELAERVGIGQVYVAQIEAASREVSLAMLGRLARALHVTPGALLDKRPTGGTEMPGPTAVRRGIAIGMLTAAHARGAKTVRIIAKDVEKAAGSSYPKPQHRMPASVAAIKSLQRPQDKHVAGPSVGANFEMEFELPWP